MQQHIVAINWRRMDQRMHISPSERMVVINDGENPFLVIEMIQTAAAQASEQAPHNPDVAIKLITKALEGKAVVQPLCNLTINL